MTYAPTTHKFAMGIGAAGAMVEVTADVLLNEGGVSRRWGRQSTFSDTSPGQFAFTLDNRDGKYTPDNPSSSLATRVTEGMRVSWELNGTLRSGKISGTQLIFPSEGKADAARLRVTVSDVLAVAARTSWDSLADGMVEGAGRFVSWPLDDDVTSPVAVEASNSFRPPLTKFMPDVPGHAVTFGVPGVPQMGGTAVMFSAPLNSGGFEYQVGLRSTAMDFVYPTDADFGYWSMWVKPTQDEVTGYTWGTERMVVEFGIYKLIVSVTNYIVSMSWDASPFGTFTDIATISPGWNHISVRLFRPLLSSDAIRATLYLNGVARSPSISNLGLPISATKTASARIELANNIADPATTATFARFSHTLRPVPEVAGVGVDATGRLGAIAATVPGLVLDTLPADLSPALLGVDSATSALDAFSTVIRGEQGHIWSDTSGTLLAPVEKVKVRARTRPEAVTSTFSTNTDIEGAPDLQRNATNMVSSVTVTGPNGKVAVYQRDLEARVGSANTSASVALANPSDLEAFGQDRILRGVNRGIDVVSFNIDPGGTSANRWAELMALTPGLRYRVADLPVAQLGVSTWDGWFLGGAESHDGERSMFTLYFEPVLARTAIYDTDRYMAGGVLSLSSNITNSATTMSIATSVVGTTFTTAGGDLPLDVVMGTEQMRVTAVTSATPQVFTITRGVNGTTAVAHTSGELLELVTQSLYAY